MLPFDAFKVMKGPELSIGKRWKWMEIIIIIICILIACLHIQVIINYNYDLYVQNCNKNLKTEIPGKFLTSSHAALSARALLFS